MKQRLIPVTALSLLLLTTSACSGTRSASTDVATADPAIAETSSRNSADDELTKAELEVLFNERKAESRSKFVQGDVDFMVGMIGHHAQALVMSDLAPSNGASPMLQRLASRIINAQKDEIATMQKWLRDRDQPVPEVHIDGLKLMVHTPGGGGGGHDSHASMPGMLTDAQLKELSEAKNGDFDRLYLTYMIQHHSGAVTMVDTLFKTYGAGQDEGSFKLASDINVDQITEIERMKKMLNSMSKMDR